MLPQPPSGYLTKSEADTRLEQYLSAGKYDDPHMPKRAEPAHVDEFVRKVLERKELGPRHMARVGELMRFYVLRARVEHVLRWLNRRESKAEELPRSITAVAIVGDLGNDDQQAQAAKYYQHLLAHRFADQHFGPLIDLFFHLPASADPKSVSAALDRRMAALEPKIESDREATVAYYELKDFKQARWVAVQAARQRGQEMLKLADPGRRRQELTRCYLGYERRPYVDFERWGMMMTQRECAEGEPAQIADVFLNEFKLLMTRGARPELPAHEAEDLKKYTTRCARAVAFYGAQLDDQQAAFATKNENAHQDDVLYWEPA